jgi:hypothetical protein
MSSNSDDVKPRAENEPIQGQAPDLGTKNKDVNSSSSKKRKSLNSTVAAASTPVLSENTPSIAPTEPALKDNAANTAAPKTVPPASSNNVNSSSVQQTNTQNAIVTPQNKAQVNPNAELEKKAYLLMEQYYALPVEALSEMVEGVEKMLTSQPTMAKDDVEHLNFVRAVILYLTDWKLGIAQQAGKSFIEGTPANYSNKVNILWKGNMLDLTIPEYAMQLNVNFAKKNEDYSRNAYHAMQERDNHTSTPLSKKDNPNSQQNIVVSTSKPLPKSQLVEAKPETVKPATKLEIDTTAISKPRANNDKVIINSTGSPTTKKGIESVMPKAETSTPKKPVHNQKTTVIPKDASTPSTKKTPVNKVASTVVPQNLSIPNRAQAPQSKFNNRTREDNPVTTFTKPPRAHPQTPILETARVDSKDLKINNLVWYTIKDTVKTYAANKGHTATVGENEIYIENTQTRVQRLGNRNICVTTEKNPPDIADLIALFKASTEKTGITQAEIEQYNTLSELSNLIIGLQEQPNSIKPIIDNKAYDALRKSTDPLCKQALEVYDKIHKDSSFKHR